MNRPDRPPGFEYMDFDDFEEALLDKPEHEKWELIGGRVIRGMVGARWEHHFITRNLAFALESRLRSQNSPCRVFSESFWLKERFIDLAVFPDVMVQCSGPLEKGATFLRDPFLLAEVVSPGSDNRDRAEKWDLYRRLPSLQHYLMIDRDRAVIDVMDRAGERDWQGMRRIVGLEAAVDLAGLGLTLPMRAIYRDVIGG